MDKNRIKPRTQIELGAMWWEFLARKFLSFEKSSFVQIKLFQKGFSTRGTGFLKKRRKNWKEICKTNFINSDAIFNIKSSLWHQCEFLKHSFMLLYLKNMEPHRFWFICPFSVSLFFLKESFQETAFIVWNDNSKVQKEKFYE